MRRPLTDEERTAKEAQLRNLHAQMNARGGDANAPSSAPPHVPSGRPPSSNPNANPSGLYSDNDDDDYDAFMHEAERVSELTAGVCMSAKPMGELMGETVETGLSVRRHIVGDFELLRLAKMGDLTSFRDFADIMAIDPATFRDNHMRNALHYAADSGDVSMLQYLIDIHVPFEKDEKKMTPIDIAVLNQHEKAVELLTSTFTEAAEVVKCHEDTIETFAPEPPRFTISRPVPPITKESRQHFFWKCEEGTSSSNTTTTGTTAPVKIAQLSESHYNSIANVLCALDLTNESSGFYNWLPPAEAVTLMNVLPRAIVVAATQTSDDQENIRGTLMAIPLGGSLVYGKGSVNIQNPFLMSHLAVHPSVRNANVAVMMMMEMKRLMKANGATAFIFCSALQLPVQAIGLVKWSRRSIAPCSVFRRRHAVEIFPEFYQFDNILRADIIAKNSITKSFLSRKAQHRTGWRAVNRADTEQLKLLTDFITSQATAAFDLALVPKTQEDVLSHIIVNGLSPFVFVSPTTDAITDLVVLRTRGSEINGGDGPIAALCVYAIFTSFKGPEKAEEVVLLAEMLKCETVLIPNMFGFLDSDLSKAMFEELLACREYLYVLSSTTKSLLPSLPLSKTAIPCLFI